MPAVREPDVTTTSSGSEATPCHKFPDFLEESLTDPRYLARCFRQLVRHKHFKNCRCDVVTFFSAVGWAIRRSTRGATGLLVWMLRNRAWKQIQGVDEDWASKQLSGLKR